MIMLEVFSQAFPRAYADWQYSFLEQTLIGLFSTDYTASHKPIDSDNRIDLRAQLKRKNTYQRELESF